MHNTKIITVIAALAISVVGTAARAETDIESIMAQGVQNQLALKDQAQYRAYHEPFRKLRAKEFAAAEAKQGVQNVSSK